MGQNKNKKNAGSTALIGVSSSFLKRFEKGLLDVVFYMTRGNQLFKKLTIVFTIVEILQLFSYVFSPTFTWATYIRTIYDNFLGYLRVSISTLSVVSYYIVFGLAVVFVITCGGVCLSLRARRQHRCLCGTYRVQVIFYLSHVLERGGVIRQLWVISYARIAVMLAITILYFPLFSIFGGVIASFWRSVCACAPMPARERARKTCKQSREMK